jgi:two-component system chemotaxis sensor kinase CheA
MDLTAARKLLVQEARELLSAMETALLEIESEGQTSERINAAFRAAHTIKGSAGLFALDLIVNFTHVMESVLERVRNGSVTLDDKLASMLLRCGDYLGQLVDAVDADDITTDPDPVIRAELIARLEQVLGGSTLPVEKVATAVAAHEAPLDVDSEGQQLGNENWHLSLRFDEGVLRNGMDPLSFIHYLAGFGKIVHLHTLVDALPEVAAFDAEVCYLGFEIDLLADTDKQSLENVFEFVRDESRIRILPPHARMAEFIAFIEAMPEASQRLGEILVSGGTLTQHELSQALALQATSKERLGKVLVEEKMVAAPVVAAALSKQKQAEDRRGQEQRVVKVEAGKLDALIDLVGELVIASAGARLLAERSRKGPQADSFVEALGEVAQLVEQIRDGALNLRMIPVGEVFQRFPRVVRDVSQELGKKIDLVITGADAELDKSMVDKLADPLMHIVRNAIDHGIEQVAERIVAGKAEQGQVHLNAYHESACIVIEVSDDGRGLDSARIRAKAVERGLIEHDAVLNEQDIFQLIFQPGFSTAEQVTNLSGRGVGMDVVKRGVEQLRGDIEISSTPGAGSTFRIRLPLTLAIIDGFQVAIGNSSFVIPLDVIVECADMPAQSGSQNLLNLRGEPLPYVRLRDIFGMPPLQGGRESLVVVECSNQRGHQRAGLVVDRLHGEFQAVIKPLGQLFHGVEGISGSTILGDGSVALIVDVPTLIQLSNTADARFKGSQQESAFDPS